MSEYIFVYSHSEDDWVDFTHDPNEAVERVIDRLSEDELKAAEEVTIYRAIAKPESDWE